MNLQERIASLVAFDARLLMLVIELKDAYDLGSRVWCYPPGLTKAGLFRGTLDDAYNICADMSSALSYLEDMSIIHDDIKALNILYDKQGRATLIDFGLSHFVSDRATQTGGSPWYKDPWSKAKDHKAKFLGDIFSLGVVMLYLIGELSLPERECGWIIHDAYLGKAEALSAQREWSLKVKAKKEELEAPVPGSVSRKEAKLRVLISRMLASASDRIYARDLAKEMDQER